MVLFLQLLLCELLLWLLLLWMLEGLLLWKLLWKLRLLLKRLAAHIRSLGTAKRLLSLVPKRLPMHIRSLDSLMLLIALVVQQHVEGPLLLHKLLLQLPYLQGLPLERLFGFLDLSAYLLHLPRVLFLHVLADLVVSGLLLSHLGLACSQSLFVVHNQLHRRRALLLLLL